MDQIEIETEKTDYTGGDVVKGRCIVTLQRQLPVRGVRIRLHGFEHSWWQSHGGRDRTSTSATKDLIDEEVTLFGQPALAMKEVLADALKGVFSKERYEVLEPGEHTYDFSFSLPDDLPGDFESPRGPSRIAYELTAFLDVPLKLDISKTVKLTVFEVPESEEADSVSRESTQESLLNTAGSVHLSVTADRDKFFPGDHVGGVIDITNSSKQRIAAVNVSLDQIVDLTARRASTGFKIPTEVMDIKDPDLSGEGTSQLTLDFRIPEDVYGSITSSQLVGVRYEIVVNLDIPWAPDVAVHLPITILERSGEPSGLRT